MSRNYRLRVELGMRLPAIIILVVIFLARNAAGQNWVEERTLVAGEIATPRIDGLLTQPLTKNFGTFEWFQIQQVYSQTYGGGTWSPWSWIQLALGAGIEQDEHPFRLGSYVWMGKGKVSGLAVFETGGSGFWWKLESNYQATRFIGIGQLYEEGKGGGIKLEFSIPHTRLKLWVAPLVKDGAVHPLFAIRFSL